MKVLALSLVFLSAVIVSSAFYIQDAQQDLEKELEKLRKEALEVLELLKKEGRQEEGKVLLALEQQVELIESQLEKLNPKTEVGKQLLAKLEQLAKVVEADLKAEIDRLKHLSVSANDETQDELEKELEKLRKEALEVLALLKKEGRQEEGKVLLALEQQVELIESQLEKLNPKTEVGKQLLAKLEQLAKVVEADLKAEIDRLKRLSVSATDETQDELEKELEKLRKEALEVLELLKKEGRQEEGKALLALEQQVELIESQLEKLNPKTEVGKQLLAKLEQLAKVVERDLKAEIDRLKRLSVSANDETRDQLEKELEKLRKEALEVLALLKKEGRQEEGKVLLALEQQVELIESQLEKLDPQTPVGKALLAKLEQLAKVVEKDLQAEIDRLKQ